MYKAWSLESLLVCDWGGYDGGYVSPFGVVGFDFTHAERQEVDATNADP